MSFKDSNMVSMYNTYNAAKTVKNTEAAAKASLVTAQANVMMTQQLDEMLELQSMGNQIAAASAQIAAQNNEELQSINQNLSSLGFAMKSGLSNIDATLNKVGMAIHDVKDSINTQTKLHKEHYDELKKEKALKEVLYSMNKFQDSLNQSTEKIASGFGAKQLLQILSDRDFKTKDLSQIADKEYYDKVVSKSKSSWNTLSTEEKQILESLEKNYFTYHQLKEFDVEELAKRQFKEKKLLSFKSNEGEIEPPVKVLPPEPQLSDFVSNTVYLGKKDILFKLTNKKEKLRKVFWFAILAIFLSFIAGMNMETKSAFQTFFMSIFLFTLFIALPGIIIGRFIIWSRIKFNFPYITKSDVKEFSLAELKLEKAIKEWEAKIQKIEKSFQRESQEYQESLDLLKNENKAEADRIENENAKINSENEKIRSEKSKMIKKHFAILEDIKSNVNGLLKENPKIQEFLPILE